MFVEKITNSQPVVIIRGIAEKPTDNKPIEQQTSKSSGSVVTTLSVLAAIGLACVAVYEHKQAKKAVEEAKNKAEKAAEDIENKIKEAVDKVKNEYEKNIKSSGGKAEKKTKTLIAQKLSELTEKTGDYISSKTKSLKKACSKIGKKVKNFIVKTVASIVEEP